MWCKQIEKVKTITMVDVPLDKFATWSSWTISSYYYYYFFFL